MPVHNKEYVDGNGQRAPNILVTVGPVLQVEIEVPSLLAEKFSKDNIPIPQPESGFALIDTGATKSCVDVKTLSKLNVSPIGITSLGTASGPIKGNLYPARLRFPAEGLNIDFNSLVGVDLTGQDVAGHPLIALIGRDVLSRMILIYNGPTASFTLAF